MTVEGDLGGALVPSVHVDTLLAQRTEILEKTAEGLALLLQADQLAGSAGFGSQWRDLAELVQRTRYHRFACAGESPGDPRPEIMEGFRKSLDVAGWNYLLSASGLRTFMDAQAREEWKGALDKKTSPAFTRGNIEATFQLLYASRGDMVERGVITAFRRLSWCHKTNLPQRFGKRIIIPYVLSYGSPRGDRIEDLMRAMCLYDGKPEPDHRSGIDSQMNDAHRQGRRECENVYFHVRWFKKGTGHLTFKRLDLVDRLNAVIAKHYPGALPAPK